MSTKIGTASNYLDMLAQLDDFLTATGHAWGKTYAGTGTGDLVDYLGTATSVAETFTLTAINATTFSVVGSTSGALANATVGTPYTSARIAFTIEAGATPFVAGDAFAINTTPPWQRLRGGGCADQTKRTSNLVNVENLLDESTTVAERAARSGFVEFEMHRPTEVREILVQTNSTTTTSPRDFALQWRDNPGDAWTTAQAWTAQTWTQNYESRVFALSSAPGAHKFWRFEVTEINGATNQLYICGLQLREKVGDAYGLQDRAEYVWRAPGLDGAKQIYIGVETYGSQTADTFNLGFTGLRSFDNTKAGRSQPNSTDQKFLALVNSPVGFWFVVNGQRLIVVTKAAGIYQTAYAGFGFAYEPPSVHTYPAIVAASINSRTLRYNSTDASFRHPADPGRYGVSAFYPDAQWRNHANRYTNSSDPEGAATTAEGVIWPTSINANGLQPSDWRENLDGSRALLPLVLHHRAGPRHQWGEFDGYFWTTGFGTTAEAIIREAGFDHLVVNNIFRVGVQHFAAVRLD